MIEYTIIQITMSETLTSAVIYQDSPPAPSDNSVLK